MPENEKVVEALDILKQASDEFTDEQRQALASIFKLEAAAPAPAADPAPAPTSGPVISDDEMADLLKGENVVPQVRKMVEKAEGRAREAEARLQELQKAAEMRQEEDALARAKGFVEGLTYLGFSPDRREETARAVHTLRKNDAPAAEAFEEMLTTTNNNLKKSLLFKELGVIGQGASYGTAQGEAEARAVEMMKSEKGLTKEQAIAQLYEQDPDLYARVEQEGLSR